MKAPVEPVKPYAVVKIADGQVPRVGSRERWPRATALLCRLKPKNSCGRQKLVSPPPPSSRQTATEAKRCSVKKKASTLPADITITFERADYHLYSKLAPVKPPRTLSTFLTEAERDAFLEYANRPNNDVTTKQEQQREEDEELSPATSINTRAVVVACADSGQLHEEIAGLVGATLRAIASESAEKISCSEDLWSKSDWSWVQRVSGSKIVYKGATFTVEEVTQPFERTEGEVGVCLSLPPHLHLRLVRAELGTTPSTLLHSSSAHYLLKDHGDAIPLTYLLQEKRQLLTSEAYLHLVLTCLAQILAAISYLHSNGICHRNITMGALCASPHGSEWLVAVGDLHCALRRPLPRGRRAHVYSLGELAWADVSVIPPEVVTSSNASKALLDCSLVDSFGVGCLIYGMMGEPHPFERNPKLLSQGYSQKELPAFCTDPASIRSELLLWTAQQFLMHDPKARMTVQAGLTLCQALLWLPPEWFQEQVPAKALLHFLAYEQAAMVCALAKQKTTTLGNVLKMHFLLHSTQQAELSHALSRVWQR